jgi:hypothetical protein
MIRNLLTSPLTDPNSPSPYANLQNGLNPFSPSIILPLSACLTHFGAHRNTFSRVRNRREVLWCLPSAVSSVLIASLVCISRLSPLRLCGFVKPCFCAHPNQLRCVSCITVNCTECISTLHHQNVDQALGPISKPSRWPCGANSPAFGPMTCVRNTAAFVSVKSVHK